MVLPIGDLNPTRQRSFVMWALVFINVGVFAYQSFALSPCGELAFVYRWAAIPQELLSGRTLSSNELPPVLNGCTPTDPTKFVWASTVSSMFLHGGLAHLAGNMIFLAVFGDNVEDRLGHTRFLLFYVVGGVAATVAFVALQPEATVPLVGASGAIAAVLGAYLVCFPRARVMAVAPFPLYLVALVLPGIRIRTWFIFAAIVSLPAWLMLGGWFLLQALAVNDPAGGLVAYEAHVAGFLAGIVLLIVLDARRSHRGREPFHPPRGRQRPGR